MRPGIGSSQSDVIVDVISGSAERVHDGRGLGSALTRGYRHCNPSQPPWILDTDRGDVGRHRQCGDLGHQAYAQPCGDQPESGRPAADGVSDDRIGQGGPGPELGVATGVVTDDPRLTGQFGYRHEVRLGQPVAVRDSDAQTSGEYGLVLE